MYFKKNGETMRHSLRHSMPILLALLGGLLFGVGLIVSGMSDPSKVLGFLDLAGRWDPSLALVMAGAIAFALPGFRFAARRRRSLLGLEIQLPRQGARVFERRLLLGSAVFGAGWGLAGLCPGPALASLLAGQSKAAVFTLAMLAGMALFELLERRPWRRAARPGIQSAASPDFQNGAEE